MRQILLMVVLAVPNLAQAQMIEWNRYSAARGSSLSVDFPSSVFVADKGASSLGTGRAFATSSGNANLSIYTLDNQNRYSPAEFLKGHFRPPSDVTVTYRRTTKGILALSGYRGGTIWYTRCNFQPMQIHCVALDYPRAEKRQWDEIVTRMSNSLSG